MEDAALWRHGINLLTAAMRSSPISMHRSKLIMKFIVSTILLMTFTCSIAAELSPKAEKEIAELFSILENSDCQFQRNGSWHEAKQAAEHLRKKYDYLRERNLLGSTESFIERAASKSSMSGKPYLVKCGKLAPVQSKDWFMAELHRLRTQ
jgi:hypothetical protein